MRWLVVRPWSLNRANDRLRRPDTQPSRIYADTRHSAECFLWSSIAASCLLLFLAGCGDSESARHHPSIPAPTRLAGETFARKPDASPLATRRLLESIASGVRPPHSSPRAPVHFRDEQRYFLIANAGSADAFVLSETVVRRVMVMPNSAALIRARVVSPPTFVSRRDWRHWRAAGSPRLPGTARASYSWTLPVGAFSFTPHGMPVTSQVARRLPASPSALRDELQRLLREPGGARPPAAMLLRQYGFLLGTAPLSRAVRKALVRAIAALPGIYTCDERFARNRRRGNAFCVNGSPTDTEILLNRTSGVALVVRERLHNLTLLYPNRPVGAVVDSDTFSLDSAR